MLSGLLALAVACADSPTPFDPNDPDIQVAVVTGNGQTGVVGQMLGAPLVVRVGTVAAPVQGALVNFVVASGGGHVWAGSALTNERGIAREWWTLGTNTAAPQIVEVRAVAPNGTRRVWGVFNATAVADVPDSIVRLLGPTNSPELLAVDPAPGLRILDRYGNPVVGHRVAFTIRRGGGTVSASANTGADGAAYPVWVPGAYNPADSLARVRMRGVGFPAGVDSAAEVQTRIYPVTDRTLMVASGDGQTSPVGSPVTVCLGIVNGLGARVAPHPHHVPAVAWTNNGGSTGYASLGIDGNDICFSLPQRIGGNSFRATIRGMAGEAVFNITGT